jgi:putative Holliday junction resolvase
LTAANGEKNTQESIATLPGRIVAIDFGLRRAGLAISDPMQIIARGLDTLTYQSRKELVKRLVNVIREHDAVKVVVGLPRHMDGSEGEMAQAVRRLTDELAKVISIPIVAWDERLSTVQAQRALEEMGVSHHRAARREEVDRLAAVFILQSYLDYLARTR